METAPDYQNKPLPGALMIIGSSFIFAVMGALIKKSSAELPNSMIVFFRNFFALSCIIPWLLFHGNPLKDLKTSCFHIHFLRSMSGLGAMYCFFYALGRLTIAEAVMLSFTYPFFVPILARFWIHETIPFRRLCAILIGFVGVGLIVKPGQGGFESISIIALCAGVLTAMAMVSIRRMSLTEPATRIVFYFSFLATIVSFIPLFFTWKTPRWENIQILMLIGILAFLGQMMLTRGYSLAPVSQIGPFGYSNIVFSSLIGWIFWNETLDSLTWFGAFFVCLAGIISSYSSEIRIGTIPGCWHSLFRSGKKPSQP